MNVIREILRCSLDLKLSNSATAKAAGCSPHTVAKVLARIDEANLSWPIDAELTDSQLKAIVYPSRAGRSKEIQKVMPDFALVAAEMKTKHMTRYLAWLEYSQLYGSAAYSYSYFTIKYGEFRNVSALSMHLDHPPGKVAFIDYCGMTVPIYDRKSGEVDFYAQVLVVTLAYSGYSYVEAQRSQQSGDFISGIVRSFEFFSGVPESLVPDNLAAAVDRKHKRSDPKINRSLSEMASHYGTSVQPARPKRPRDKAKVEQMVGYIERRILASIRKLKFYDLGELNEVIWNLADLLNATRFQTLDTSRAELFEKNELMALKPLNAIPYEYAIWKTTKAGPNYHVPIDKNYYSVPYGFRNRRLEARISNDLVQIFSDHSLIAVHKKCLAEGSWITESSHMPKSHLSYGEVSADAALSRAERIGKSTKTVAGEILDHQYSSESAILSAMALVRLCELYGRDELERACEIALSIGSPNRASVTSILKHGIKSASVLPPVAPVLNHENIRGPAYYANAVVN